jgi:RHS repeat-associated protein
MVPAAGSALYYAEDQLGSSRVIVQSNGTLCYDADFTPFGAERSYVSTCAQNYKFEGKERDTETQNDDFGARFYSWRFGRWLSSDWSAVPVPVPYANLTNPQTLNLYSMVADDPGSFADLDGHEGFWGAVLAQQWDQAAEEEQTQASQTVQQSSVTQTDTISAAQPAQNAGVRQLDPNSQECKDLAKKIDNIASDIKKRDQEVAANPLNLPETAPPGSPPRSSVEGHRQIIKDLIDNLGAAADLYNNKCGGGPPPPLSPVVNTVPVPVGPPSSISPKAIVGVIVVGAAIALIPETGGLSLAAVF